MPAATLVSLVGLRALRILVTIIIRAIAVMIFILSTARLVIRQIPRLQGHDSPWLVLGDGRGCVGLERQFAFLKHFF